MLSQHISTVLGEYVVPEDFGSTEASACLSDGSGLSALG